MLLNSVGVTILHWTVVVVLAALAVVSPLTDALAFGLHDHIAGDPGARAQWTASGDSDLTPSHHCELSASPLGLALAPEMPPLCSSGPVVPAVSVPAPFADQLVQPSPPRL